MGNIDGDGEGTGPEVRDRIRVRCLVSFTGRLGLRFELGPGSDVRARAR